MLSLILFIVVTFLIFSHISLQRRVDELEEKLLAKKDSRSTEEDRTQIEDPAPAPITIGDLKKMTVSTTEPITDIKPVSTSFKSGPTKPTSPAYESITATKNTVSEPAEFFMYSWFKEQALIKIGAIIFFLGAAWFVGYAIDQNWLSPLTRIMLGLVGVCVLYAIGYWRAPVAVLQYQVMTVLGTGVLLGTVAASQFSFVIPVLMAPVAFALMIVGISYCTYVALKTKTEWLAVTAVVAGLIAPLLIASTTPNYFTLLTYLLLMSIGFLLTAAVTIWRYVPLVLVFGISFYVSEIFGNIANSTLWVFVCLFAIIFTASVSFTVVRLGRIVLTDIVTLLSTLLLFLITAYAMPFSTTLVAMAQFIAATAIAGIAYLLQERRASDDSTFVYSLLSVALIFIATSNLFSGVTLTIIFAIEALVLLIGSSLVTTTKRYVYVAASTFVIPFLFGLFDLYSILWRDDIWHLGLFGVVVLLGALGTAVVWLLENPNLKSLPWVQTIAAILLGGWFIYMWMAVSAIDEVITKGNPSTIFILLATMATLLVTTYIGLQTTNYNWRAWILVTWIPPVLIAIDVLFEPIWSTGILHTAFGATSGLVIALGYLVLFYGYLSKHQPLDERDSNTTYALLWGTIIYIFFWLYAIWYAVYPNNIALVAQYVSYFVVLSITVYALLWLRARFVGILSIICFGAIPLLLSLGSYHISGWGTGILSINALGVYTSSTLTLMLAYLLTTYRGRTDELEIIEKTRLVLYWIGGLQVFVTIWIITHTLANTDATAVTIALFIYTIAGLVSYSYGRMTEHVAIKRVGVLLLATVVLRLGLVDVWSMEIIWRIVTFLGIGTLFILTALLERPGSKHKIVDKN